MLVLEHGRQNVLCTAYTEQNTTNLAAAREHFGGKDGDHKSQLVPGQHGSICVNILGALLQQGWNCLHQIVLSRMLNHLEHNRI